MKTVLSVLNAVGLSKEIIVNFIDEHHVDHMCSMRFKKLQNLFRDNMKFPFLENVFEYSNQLDTEKSTSSNENSSILCNFIS